LQLRFIGALFEYTNGEFNSGTGQRFLSFENSTFRHLTIETTSYFLLTGGTVVGGISENFFKNCTFENISAYHSVIRAQKNGIQLTLDGVSMNNMKKLKSNDAEDLQLDAQWPGGLCTLTNSDVSLTVKNSNFTNIYGHCFGTKQTALIVENSTFDNSNLDETPITLTAATVKSLTKNSGTTWVNIENPSEIIGMSNQAIFKRNIFKTNKRVSLYGGVIIHHYLMITKNY